MKNKIKALIIILLTLSPAIVKGQTVGQPAPNFTFSVLNGEFLSLSDFSGKVVFIFTFGNQCPSCIAIGNRTETDVNQVFSPTGEFQAIGMDTWDNSSSVTTVSEFKQLTGITYPLTLQSGSFEGLYQTTFDRVLVIDQTGILQYKGATLAAFTLDDAIDVIRSLLQSPVEETETGYTPEVFRLDQNYPNPFNPSTTIRFDLPIDSRITLKIYDTLGIEVTTLIDDEMKAGNHSVVFDARNLSSGMYFYRIQANGYTKTRKLILQR